MLTFWQIGAQAPVACSHQAPSPQSLSLPQRANKSVGPARVQSERPVASLTTLHLFLPVQPHVTSGRYSQVPPPGWMISQLSPPPPLLALVLVLLLLLLLLLLLVEPGSLNWKSG